MRALGEDASEQLAPVAAAFMVIRTIRRKLVCRYCGNIIIQMHMLGLPNERSIAHPSLLADILVSKYVDHQPLYQQSALAARRRHARPGQCGPLGRPVRGTVCCADGGAAPLYSVGQQEDPYQAALGLRARRSPLGFNVTGFSLVPLLTKQPGHSPSNASRQLQWDSASRRLRGPRRIVSRWRDGAIREAACHAHARRKFYEIHVRTSSDTTQEALDYIGGL